MFLSADILSPQYAWISDAISLFTESMDAIKRHYHSLPSKSLHASSTTVTTAVTFIACPGPVCPEVVFCRGRVENDTVGVPIKLARFVVAQVDIFTCVDVRETNAAKQPEAVGGRRSIAVTVPSGRFRLATCRVVCSLPSTRQSRWIIRSKAGRLNCRYCGVERDWCSCARGLCLRNYAFLLVSAFLVLALPDWRYCRTRGR